MMVSRRFKFGHEAKMDMQRGRINVTISDVARFAQVSIKSVSRVINNEPHVSEKLRTTVEAAIASLNYIPDMAARSLAGSRSFIISVLFDNPSPNYTMDIITGAYRACVDRKYHLRIDNLDTTLSPAVLEKLLRELVAHSRTDGMVLTPPLSDNAQLLDFLESRDIRYVRVAPISFPGRSMAVMIDDGGAAAQIAELLWEQGHRRFGILNGPVFHGAAHTRRKGFVDRLNLFDPAVEVAEAQGEFAFEIGIKGGLELLSRPDRPTAIFATNDDSAAGLMAACAQLGLRVPEDVSICGFDDSWVARSVWPFLTTVRQPVKEMAQAAALMLLDRANGDERAQVQKLDFEVITRGTVAPPASAQASA